MENDTGPDDDSSLPPDDLPPSRQERLSQEEVTSFFQRSIDHIDTGQDIDFEFVLSELAPDLKRLLLSNSPGHKRQSFAEEFAHGHEGSNRLHKAVRQRYDLDVINGIMDHNPAYITSPNSASHIPLVAACVEASNHGLDEDLKQIIQCLVQRGEKLNSSDARFAGFSRCALCATIPYEDISDEVIKYILEVGSKEVLGQELVTSMNCLPQHYGINQSNRSDDFLAHMFREVGFTLKGCPERMRIKLAERIFRSKNLQKVINGYLVRRWPSFLLFLEFYIRSSQVVVFFFKIHNIQRLD